MAEAKSKAQIADEWWAAWWEQDFTWDGLAKWPLVGWVIADGLLRETETGRVYGQSAPEAPALAVGREATLQDYWRADPATGRLRSDTEMVHEWVEAEGQPLFHRVHLPLAYQDGVPTGKDDWADDALDALTGPRLIAATETVWQGNPWDRTLVGADGRAQFQGGVWLRAAVHPQGIATPLSLRYEFSSFCRMVIFLSARFSGDSRFDSASFSGNARFDSATFSGNVSFDHATFSGDARFGIASFSGDARFDSASFSGDARFDNATFSGDASFYSASFSGNASFHSASVSGDASFDNATFSGIARFHSATVSGDASFVSATVSCDAIFVGATFSGNASLNRATFSGDARFTSATFCRTASFSSANVSGNAIFDSATFSGNASFYSASVSGDASFNLATFSGNANFNLATFSGNASFYSASFSDDAIFDSASFSGDARFDSASFERIFAFKGATFSRNALFNNAEITGPESGWRDAFSGCLFERLADWSGAPRLPIAAFSGARFDRGLLLSRASEGEDGKAHRTALKEALALKDKSSRQSALKALEGGALQIKLAMEQASDRVREQRFYRLELQARRKQSGTPWTEKFFSWLYAGVSKYGASMGRPFASLGGLVAAFAALFYGWSFGFDPAALIADRGAGAVQALDLSWRNVFRPFSALSTDVDYGESNPLAARLLYDAGGAVDATGLAVRAVSTLQSLFALVLAFLFALAVRRRFQIS